MITQRSRGNILESDCQTLVCPVNVVGVMGAGLAKQFKETYPTLLPAYRKACFDGLFRQGYFLHRINSERQILCIPTKRHWKNPSKLEWIVKALTAVVVDFDKLNITSLAVPALGCGLGQLSWDEVSPVVEQLLEPLPCSVVVYEP